MDFLERQQITFFIITGLTELWSRTGSCFERRFDFVVGDIVDSTYLTDRFLRDGRNSVKVKVNTLTSGQRCWKGVISDSLDLFWVRNEKIDWIRFAVVINIFCDPLDRRIWDLQ